MMDNTTTSTPAPGVTPTRLKSIAPSQLPPLAGVGRSDTLHPSSIPANANPRAFYLAMVKELGNSESVVPPPLISCSEFVPKDLVELLMRKKKDGALGVKFVGHGGFRTFGRDRLDEITDLEGAMHTFVTPVVGTCEMVGDYRFGGASGGHGVCSFGAVQEGDGKGKFRLTRTVVLSASIQMDFEGSRVMLRACKLDNGETVGGGIGRDSGWEILSTQSKQDDQMRKEYDEGLRRLMVFHLTRAGRLPAKQEIKNATNIEGTIKFLADVITGQEDVEELLVGKYAELGGNQVISLELLFNTAVHQARNEFSALEALCTQGYVYTYDPASIFARKIGAPILNLLMLAAVRHLSRHVQLTNMRVFAFNDYADTNIMVLVRKALEGQKHVRVARKAELFRGPGGRYDVGGLAEARGAMLVVHNNSDGFGQNVETEYEYGSLDGAVGSNCSAAAGLERNRMDLLDYIC